MTHIAGARLAHRADRLRAGDVSGSASGPASCRSTRARRRRWRRPRRRSTSCPAGACASGLGVSHRPVVEGWHGQTIDRPVAEMREYVADRARDPARRGRRRRARSGRRASALSGLDPRPELPIYVAALSPGMLRLAGEIADGVILWLCNPALHPRRRRARGARRARARRQVARGLRRRGRRPGGRGRGPRRAYAAMRRDLLPYFGLPFYRAMLERSGFERGHRRLRRGRRARRRRGMQPAISERFLAS